MAKLITTSEHPEAFSEATNYVKKYQAEGHEVHSQFFTAETLKKLLETENFGGLKIHHGRDGENLHTLVLEATDEDGGSLGTYVCDGPLCPPNCIPPIKLDD
ncbi:hypothetical protein [Flectobacillus major]|jgi:hypothetical protein|uniref:hypothetical protein n=1 Tax=Flectobacillus major TaxID=103 RepID=UPI00040DD008|nr:hypothetical protein [Flectobacillus major]